MALREFGRRIGNPMRWCRREPTIMEILSDSIVRTLMEADGIDPEVLEAQLWSMAREFSAVRDAGQVGSPTPATSRLP
jgi:hypothetical protein